MMTEQASITIDLCYDQERQTETEAAQAFGAQFGIAPEQVTLTGGHAGGWPEVRYGGTREQIETLARYHYQGEPRTFIDERIKLDPSAPHAPRRPQQRVSTGAQVGNVVAMLVVLPVLVLLVLVLVAMMLG